MINACSQLIHQPKYYTLIYIYLVRSFRLTIIIVCWLKNYKNTNIYKNSHPKYK